MSNRRETTDAKGRAEALRTRKRAILWRARHRGMKETDILFGRLVEETLEELDEAGVAAFEALLDVPDTELLEWVSGKAAVPESRRGPLMDRLLSYRFSAEDYGDGRNG